MASKKKAPSFEIPAAVQGAGQAGWVYRTEGPGKSRERRHRRAAARTPVPDAVGVVEPVVVAAVPPAAAEVSAPAAAPTVTGRLVGLGLHVAAVPFVVPLYLTAVVSKRLGTGGGQ